MKNILLVGLLVFTTTALADNNVTNPIVSKTLIHNLPKSPVDDDNRSNWNIKNWHESLSGDAGEGVVGNTMLFMDSSPFLKRGMTTDSSKLTTESFNSDKDPSAAAAGYTDSYRTEVMTGAVANKSFSPVQNPNENTLKCFIARDLPFRYRCEETNLVYGGSLIAHSSGGKISNMDGMSGKEAFQACKDNCKKSAKCVTVEADDAETNSLGSRIINLVADPVSEEFITVDDKKINAISFEVSSGSEEEDDKKKSNIKMDISYVDSSGKTVYLIKSASSSLLRGSKRIHFGNMAKKIIFTFKNSDTSDNEEISIEIKDFSIEYESNSKHICAALQHISHSAAVEPFAKRCPSGRTVKFDDIEICVDGVHAGDNSDGTYSDKARCESSCNISKKCSVEYGSFDSTIFEEFREGRLGRISADGEFTSADVDAIMQDTDCTKARIEKAKVVNEVSYNADGQSFQTVLNGSLVPDIDRPRISAASNIDYETSKKEEWKDAAYDGMLNRGTYSSTANTIGTDTKSSFAFYISLEDGASYGDATFTSKRALVWRLKPNSLFYNNNINYKLYSVVKVDVEKYQSTYTGRRTVRDQIWYIKTSSNTDSFKPFVRAKDYATASVAKRDIDNMFPTLNYNRSATFKGETFNGANWVGASLHSIAPSFANVSFKPDEFWYEFKIFERLGKIHYSLPGIIRRIVPLEGGYETNYYGGDFDGTGEGVAGYQVYTFFSENALSYNDLVDKIEAIDNSNPTSNQVDDYGAKIYDMVNAGQYDMFVKSDNVNTNSGVEIYQYGSADNHSLKVRIKPKAADIGKNGFVFIFVY